MTATAQTYAAQRAALEQVERDEAAKAIAYAAAMRTRADIAQLWADERSGFAEMELAGTALVGQIRAARELDDAVRLQQVFLRTSALLSEGVLYVPTAELLLRETRTCTPQVQSALDTRLAGQLVGMNTTDARRLIARTILAVEAEIDPALTQDRLDGARKDARVWVSPGTDGMTAIGAVLDAVIGRRRAVDFEQLVHAQSVLDRRDGVQRPVQEVRAAVFATLPTLVLELCRAARDGRLSELAEVADLDPTAALELQQLALSTADLPLPTEPEEAAEPTPAEEATRADGTHAVVVPEVRVETDPFDDAVEAIVVLDPYAGLPTAASTEVECPVEGPEEAADPFREPPPAVLAAQDAAQGPQPHSSTGDHDRAGPPIRCDGDGLLVDVLRLPLRTPTTVLVHLPMATALGLSTAPAHLEGHGPLPASRTRLLLPTATLRTLYVDETTGVPLGTDKHATTAQRPAPLDVTADLLRRLQPAVLTETAEPQHDPSAALAELIDLRDQHCSGPGCTMPASRCDCDHLQPYPDGPTATWNLGLKSRRCHTAKHHGWTADRHDDGSTTWTSPTGRSYTTPSTWTAPPTVHAPRGLQLHLPTRRSRSRPHTRHDLRGHRRHDVGSRTLLAPQAKESTMNDIAIRYLAAWNETDGASRRTAVEAAFTPDVTYVDPLVDVRGAHQLDATMAAVQAQFPGFVFTLLGDVDAHHDVLRFRWGLGPEGQEPVVEGFDVAVTDGSRVSGVTGFLDKVPG